MAFELLFLLLIGATSFTEFSPEGLSGNSVDKFFRVFYCGLIPMLFQWVLFEFFMSILADAFGEEKEILDDIEATGDTLPNDIKKLIEYRIATMRGEWPRFEDAHDLLKTGIKVHRASHKQEEKTKADTSHVADIDEDCFANGNLNVEELAFVIKKSFPNKANAIFTSSDSDLSESSLGSKDKSIRKFAQKLLSDKPARDDVHEILKSKLRKVTELKLNACVELQERIEEVSAELTQHLVEQKSKIEHAEKLGERWKRIREFVEDIEAALEEFGFTKETFDKKKLKLRVRELRESRAKANMEEKKKWMEAVEIVKKVRAKRKQLTKLAKVASVIRRKSRNEKLKKLLAERALYEKPHSSSSANRRHKEEILDQKKMVEKDLQALESFVARK
jgi:hypothetical protein